MAIDAEFLLTGLLGYNYLPTSRRSKEELPPNFSSVTFTVDAARKLAALNVNRRIGFDQIEYRLTRFNNAGRCLSIPHPLPHAQLCLTLSKHLEKFGWVLKNKHSNIKPQQYEDGRVIVMNGYADSNEKTNRYLSQSFGQRYVVCADVANFFPSLYSHAIPWALVGFNEAKEKSTGSFRTEWFNQIDACVRQTRRNETQGVAIGPATSNIIGEFILGRVDEALKNQGFVNFSRYIDDYSHYCSSEEEAQRFLHSLECELAKFKLQLNVKKTTIERLPKPTTEPWIIELGQSAFFDKDKDIPLFDVYRFLDSAQVLAEKYPDGNILKYAVATVLKMPIRWDFSGDLLQYLLSLAFHFPFLLPLLETPIEEDRKSFVGYDDVGNDLVVIARENTRLRRSDGICWALYFLGRLECKIPVDLAEKIIEIKDCLSIVSLYWATDEHRQLVVDYAKSIDRTHLYDVDRYWMLFYQLYRDGLFPEPYEGDQTFATLRAESVNFLVARTPFKRADSIFPAIPQNIPSQ